VDKLGEEVPGGPVDPDVPVPDVAVEPAGTVAAGSGRRRIIGISIASVAAVIAIVAISAAVIAQGGSAPATSPSATESASESPTPSDPESASPSPSVEELVAAPHVGTGFPEAFVLTDSVLAQAGPGWAVESYASYPDVYDQEPAPPTASAVYLVDPTGAHFLAYSTGPSDAASGLTAVAWRESTGEVVLDHGDWGVVEVLDLSAGEATPLLASLLGVPSTDTVADLVMAAADGAELWRAWDGTSSRYVRWSDDGGYEFAAIDRKARGDSSFTLPPEWDQEKGLRRDGRVALFHARDNPDDYTSQEPDTLYAYDVSTDLVLSSRFTPGATIPDNYECYFETWQGADSLSYFCNLSSTNLPWTAVIKGLPALGDPVPTYASESQIGVVGMTSRIAYGNATDPQLLLPACSC